MRSRKLSSIVNDLHVADYKRKTIKGVGGIDKCLTKQKNTYNRLFFRLSLISKLVSQTDDISNGVMESSE